jgi:ornithine cyclodeaminase/alanine dehydrogenase
LNKNTLLLSQSEVSQLVTIDEVIDTVEEVFKAHGRREVVMPAKITLDLKRMGIESWTNAMPAYIKPLNAAGIKWAGGYINNSSKGLPYIFATIILQDPETGQQISIMDGAYITNLRTGAVAGLCAKYFARSNATKVAIIGGGTQARTSLDAMTRLLQIQEVWVYDKLPVAAEQYATDMSLAHNLHVTVARTAQDAVEGADIIVTATPSDEPIVQFKWIKKGSVSISLGSYQEFDDQTPLASDKVYVDSWDQCQHRGELAHLVGTGAFTRENLYGEIGDYLVGQVAGRESDSETILVVPIGLGSLDIAIGKRVYDKARSLNSGMYVSIV